MAVKRAARAASSANEDLIGVYLAEIGRHPLLDRDDECRLSAVIDAGRNASLELTNGEDVTARERVRLRNKAIAGDCATTAFIEANLRLVVSIAKRYQS